jgi:formamidopyrimidine-DNA glycosylase
MPELPEVETIARTLRRVIVGKRIASVRLSGLPLRRPLAGTLEASLRGRTVRRVLRRGQYLAVELEPRAYLVVHLGMSGRLFYEPCGSAPEIHTHAIVGFSDSSELRYRDPRRFGLISFHACRRLGDIPELRALGIDPLGSRLTAEWLAGRLEHTRREVKSFLLDQRLLAGLGNIYVCEALFRAGIHPARRCHTLARSDAVRLAAAVRAVLRAAVRNRGTTFSDFMDSNGEAGDNQRFLRVFQREGERCLRCRRPIERLRQANRSSFFCPRCQPSVPPGGVARAAEAGTRPSRRD